MNKPIIRVAVYGTLCRGGWNHERYMSGYLNVRENKVRGRLHPFTRYIPILEVPEEDMLAMGTEDYSADVGIRLILEDGVYAPPSADGWNWVPVEIYEFDDLVERMARLDRLEGFWPNGDSNYRRVLVRTLEGVLTWIYVR